MRGGDFQIKAFEDLVDQGMKKGKLIHQAEEDAFHFLTMGNAKTAQPSTLLQNLIQEGPHNDKDGKNRYRIT